MLLNVTVPLAFLLPPFAVAETELVVLEVPKFIEKAEPELTVVPFTLIVALPFDIEDVAVPDNTQDEITPSVGTSGHVQDIVAETSVFPLTVRLLGDMIGVVFKVAILSTS